MEGIIKITQEVAFELKEAGIYKEGIYQVKQQAIINERGQPITLQWWLLEHELLTQFKENESIV